MTQVDDEMRAGTGPNKAFGVALATRDGDGPAQALVVVARDEQDAELVACGFAGADASVETFRELSDQEILEYGLDLSQHGSAKSLAVPQL